MERMDRRLKASEEMYEKLSGTVESLRLEVKNLSTPIENSANPITQPTMKTADSFAQKESPFVLDVSTLRCGRGAIVFDGNEMFPHKRRFWTLEKAGEMRFTLDNNELQPNSRITFSGFKTTANRDSDDYLEQVYIISSTSNGTELTVSGVVIFITMTSTSTKAGRGLNSSFALSFLHNRNDSVLIPRRTFYPSSFVVAEDGKTMASFPTNNAVDYVNNADHFMLVFRANGRDFKLTETFRDIEPDKDYVRRYSIADDAEKTWFHGGRPISGRLGYGRWDWGGWSARVFFFSSDPCGTGKGYEFAME